MSDNYENDYTKRQYERKQNFVGAVLAPVYDDMANADAELSSIAISNGQHPHGFWWHNGSKWFSGDRIKFNFDKNVVGSTATTVINTFEMPTDMDINIWQSQVSVVDGTTEDVVADIFDSTAGSTLYEHGFQEHGTTIVFGDPVSSVAVPDGNAVQLRITNNTAGDLTVSGWILWSFQEQV